jgi:exopolysaccharide production protein ExoY
MLQEVQQEASRQAGVRSSEPPLIAPTAQSHSANSALSAILKRSTDIIVGCLSLIVLTPLLVLLLVVNAIVTRGNPLFRQIRVGRDSRPIRVYKFRSMIHGAEERLKSDPELYSKYLANGHKLPKGEDPRITRFGHFLRKSSLDELPQLWCVAVGSMSMVGPRPVLPAELESLYGIRKSCYLSTKPGITGQWQISGRSRVVGEARVDLDCTYADTRSFFGDLKILFATVPAVLCGRGSH